MDGWMDGPMDRWTKRREEDMDGIKEGGKDGWVDWMK